MFGEVKHWKGWLDIKKWAESIGCQNLANRLQLNNDCWMSSGEFGRSQKEICDNLRFAKSEEEALKMAREMDKQFATNYGLYQKGD